VTVGITIWVVSDGRYQPQNFPFYRIDDSELVWDFATRSSNYTTLRAQHETALANKGWEIESSLDLNKQVITQAIQSGGVVSGGAPASNAADDYLPVPGDPDAGTEAGAAGQTADDVRNADLATLYGGLSGATVRVTRMRGDIAHAAMNVDLVLAASPDQSELSNVRTVTKQVHAFCPSYPSCPADGGSGSGSASGSGSGGAGSGSSADATGGGGGCATTGSSETSASTLATVGALCMFVVVSVVRSRRRRWGRSKT
jgi:hypothetical protein